LWWRPGPSPRSPARCCPARKTAGTAAGTDEPGLAFGLLDPFAHRGLGQVENSRDLAHRPVPSLAQHDLDLELRGERTARPGLSPSPLLSIVGHPSWGRPLMVDVCKSGSGRPRSRRAAGHRLRLAVAARRQWKPVRNTNRGLWRRNLEARATTGPYSRQHLATLAVQVHVEGSRCLPSDRGRNHLAMHQTQRR